MDILLEFVDTFIADYAYAYFFPIQLDLKYFPHKTGVNASTAMQFFQPSQAAYMSSMTRGNPYRQLFTLFFIVW